MISGIGTAAGKFWVGLTVATVAGGAVATDAIEIPRDRESAEAMFEQILDEMETVEENFAAAERRSAPPPDPGAPALTILHSGVLYPSERDPRALFEALRVLKTQGRIDASTLRIVLRASGHDEEHGRAIHAAGIEDLVHLAPPLPYAAALEVA